MPWASAWQLGMPWASAWQPQLSTQLSTLRLPFSFSHHFPVQSLSVLASHAPINGSAVLEYNVHNLYGLTQVCGI